MTFGHRYPRMYLGVTAGILDGRHHKRLGAAWMLFLWCCCRQTGQGEEGIVCRGNVVTYEEIAEEINCKRGTVREWMARLVEQNYIRLERNRRGVRIFVLNPKKSRVSKVQHSKPIVSVGTGGSRVPEPQHSKPIHAVENTATSEKLLRNYLTKQQENNNTTAAAETAADGSSLFRKTLRQLQPQRPCLGERQRHLDQQAKLILDKYSPGWRKATATA